MNYFKVVLMLWTYNMAFDTSETAAIVRGSINPWENKQKYCGELLTRAIQIVCVEMRIERGPRDTVRQVAPRHGRNLLLQKSCCDDVCSLNFIKTHCPVKRRSNKKNKNSSVVQSPVNSTQKSITTRTNTTTLPFDTFLRPKMKNATVSTSATTTTSTSTTPRSTTPRSTTPRSTTPTSTTPRSTTPTSTTPTSTTSTSTTTTTTTTFIDYEFYLGLSPW